MRQRRAWSGDGSQALQAGANRFCPGAPPRECADPPFRTSASRAMSADEKQRVPTQGALRRTGSPGYQSASPDETESNGRQADSPGHQTGNEELEPGSRDNQIGSEEQEGGSAGYQTGSDEPPSSAEVPGSGSDADERIDPFQAYAQSAAKERERKKREREPGMWLPGSEDLDQEPVLADQETRFSRDAWGGRRNPQVSVRLRPMDFDRLRRAAELYSVRPTTLARTMVIRGIRAILDTELRRSGELLRERDRF
jgi:hypothetical protein